MGGKLVFPGKPVNQPNLHWHPLLLQTAPFAHVATFDEFDGHRQSVGKANAAVDDAEAALAQFAFDPVKTFELGETTAFKMQAQYEE
jgi:hypothetical protein